MLSAGHESPRIAAIHLHSLQSGYRCPIQIRSKRINRQPLIRNRALNPFQQPPLNHNRYNHNRYNNNRYNNHQCSLRKASRR